MRHSNPCGDQAQQRDEQPRFQVTTTKLRNGRSISLIRRISACWTESALRIHQECPAFPRRMAREVGSDARARKRERDKQNQRQRRRRERDAFEELQRKNELLEQQVKALRGGNTSDVQSLSDTVQRLEQRNKDLKDRLETVDHFIKLWNSKGTEASSRSESAIDNKTSNGVSVPISQVSSPASSTPLVACRSTSS